MAKARKAPRRGASRATTSARRGIPGWLWLVSGLVLGLFVAFLFQLEPGRDSVKRDRTPPVPAPQSAPAPKQPEQPRYDFYTLLPESEVIVPQRPVPEVPTPPAAPSTPPTEARPETPTTAQPSTRFFLQAGSFRQRAEADRVRAQIIMLGMDVQLENAKLASGETWRVQVGPFPDRNSLDQAQKTLAGNGFTNLLVQQRNSAP